MGRVHVALQRGLREIGATPFSRLWVPMGPEDLPEAVRRVQYAHGDFGEVSGLSGSGA